MDYLIKSRVSALRNPKRTVKWLHGEVKRTLNEQGKKCGCLHNFYKAALGAPLTKLTESEIIQADEILRWYESKTIQKSKKWKGN